MVIKTKTPVEWGREKASGKLLTPAEAANVRADEKAKEKPGKPVDVKDSAVEVKASADLHIFLAFSSNPAEPDGWNLALTLCPAEPDQNGDKRALMELRRSASYTHNHCTPKVHDLASAIQAALQKMVDAQEG